MAFVYHVGLPSTVGVLTTHGTTNTELTNMALRLGARNADVAAIFAGGKGSALTTITGISCRGRRWTTVGTGGTSITPAPRRIGTTAASAAVSSSGGAITQGTVDGSTQVAFSFGAAGPGGWVARDDDSKITLEAGSLDELALNTISVGISLGVELSFEFSE